MLPMPRALLLDFGGVLADAPPGFTIPPELVRRLVELAGGARSAEEVTRDLSAASRAYARWRDDVGNRERSMELPHARVWAEFLTPDWPAPAREAVEREATPLAYLWTRRPEWAVRPGIPEVLAAAARAGLPMAIVSNTLCGAAHRDFLRGVGLDGRFAAQFYSDEAGPRKPNPELARLAARAVAVPVGDCWFVGDSVHRDIVCARRAGVGAAVLMRSPRTDGEPPLPGFAPDAVVDDGHGLLALLRDAEAVAPAG
ncbi:HAD family hydrolase [Micromonospora sp. NBC_01655]|uniref:HAD family hydrolase n=1 Tax=Micromonospora sp. NBC_01655 TaxID=2975983 RepID=UPI00225BA59D|nr:HAD family hydrolase [Micromonospora sp. NBC_01655]MCX4472089.1 HAD family hydrolase [Micromonospora sp. NBC_01655]